MCVRVRASSGGAENSEGPSEIRFAFQEVHYYPRLWFLRYLICCCPFANKEETWPVGGVRLFGGGDSSTQERKGGRKAEA